MKVYEEFTTEDYKVNEGWLRVLACPLHDDSCGFLLFQHHYSKYNDTFDHLTEANIGFVTGPSYQSALKRITTGGDVDPLPAAYRRLSRLLQNGSLESQILDTLSERGLVRAIAFTDREPQDKRLAMFKRAGWRTEERSGKLVYILDLEK